MAITYARLSPILLTDILAELETNFRFAALTATQKVAVLESVQQRVCDLYDAAGKDNFLVNTSMSSGIATDVAGVVISPQEVYWSAATYDEAGQQIQLYAIVVPLTATIKTVAWSSSNEAIATVNSGGLVTKMKEFTWAESDPVIITVTTDDGGFTNAVSIDQRYPG